MKYLAFSKLQNKGRLGNQMFQIASCFGLAAEHDFKPVFPSWRYGKYFKGELPRDCPDGEIFRTVKEKHFHYHEWELPEGNVDIDGYLQSEKYFDNIPFQWDDDFLRGTIARYGPALDAKPSICVQVRRGDFVGNVNYYQLPVTYFIKGITFFHMWQDMNIFFISDDMDWCKLHFGCLPNAIFPDGNEVEHMCLGSLCDRLVISNSSFGWWAARLAEERNPDTKVIHPGHVFAGNMIKNDTKDYWPRRWIRLQSEQYKLDLKDITFTIPVFYDHRDRMQNLNLSVCILQKYVDTNIMVGEQGGDVFRYMGQWCEYMEFPFQDFHRTKMLNEMALKADTPYIANWDCDVIIPPMQLLLTAMKLRDGADMVYPYGGNFIRLGRECFKNLERTLDIGVVASLPEVIRKTAENSVGGAVFFNKQSFINGGMENEYMISFAPEDVERYERFNVLGYNIQRAGGNLFHINHYIGKDSSKRNPYFYPNHAELAKIRAMSKRELLAYINTWYWRPKYSDDYYAEIVDGAVRSARAVYKILNKKGLGWETVLDVGCGVGEWFLGADVIRKDDLENYVGIDRDVPKESLLIYESQYIDCNLELEFPQVDKADMVLCLEVAEHISERRANDLIKFLCDHSNRYVLFSAAIPYQGGTGHINEQWQSYWAEKFQENGFGGYTWGLNEVRTHPDIELWYRQNMVLYVKDHSQPVEDFVLPEYYMQIIKGLKQK